MSEVVCPQCAQFGRPTKVAVPSFPFVGDLAYEYECFACPDGHRWLQTNDHTWSFSVEAQGR